MIVEKAMLHVRSATPEDAPIMRLGASSVASPWEEGTRTRYRKETGSACFSQSRYQEKDWAYPGSSVLDVVFGKGHTAWGFSDCSPPEDDGWQVCAVQPDVVAARVAGISHGICLFDEVGSTWSLENGKFEYHNFPNRFFYSRESRYAPWLEVWVSGKDQEPPEPVKSFEVQAEGLADGEALCIWETPMDSGGGKTIGFHVEYEKDGRLHPIPRYLIPMAGKSGQRVKMRICVLGFAAGESITLHIRPVDSTGNVWAAIIKKVTLSKAPKVTFPKKFPEASYFKSNSIAIDSGTISVLNFFEKVDPSTGKLIPSGKAASGNPSHLFDAESKKMFLHGARNETIWFQINVEGSAKELDFNSDFKDHMNLKWHIYKFDYVQSSEKTKARWLPDPLIFLNSGSMVRNPSRKGEEKFANQSYLFELYIPHHEAPGKKTGQIRVTINGQALALDVALTVWDFILPDKLSFIPEMNAYSRVSPFKGYDDYVLAHEHRTCLNRLPYDWKGKPEFAPIWDGKDFGWEKWDEYLGPLLDGSAFKGCKRKGEPVDVLYLPFSENWPVNIAPHYTKSYWADEALAEQYRTDLGRAFSLFAAHLNHKGWDQTIYEFYLNNKVYHRKEFAQGSAPWIFDEPVNTQDFWALRWYGQLWQESVAPYRKDAILWFRADISYSQYARNLLWGIMDVAYTGGNTPQKVRMKQDEWLLWERSRYFEYGSANKIEEDNIQPALWCLSAWSKGAMGVLPWQTLGNQKSWETADQNALFYPDENGPVPSVRLKAFTYGQQLVEYLTLLMKTYNLPRHAVVAWLDS